MESGRGPSECTRWSSDLQGEDFDPKMGLHLKRNVGKDNVVGGMIETRRSEESAGVMGGKIKPIREIFCKRTYQSPNFACRIT